MLPAMHDKYRKTTATRYLFDLTNTETKAMKVAQVDPVRQRDGHTIDPTQQSL